MTRRHWSRSAFVLPDGKVQIAFSGGRTSAFMLHSILEANGALPIDRVRVVFTNTGREMPETLDFVHEVGARWGVAIDWVEFVPEPPRFQVVSHNSAARNGEPFEALIRKKQFLPNQHMRLCTAFLKVKPAAAFIRSLGWDRWTVAVGIRADEAHRSATQPKERWTNWRPLVNASVSKADVAAFWKAQPFDLRLATVNGRTPLGNCDGCFLKSEAHLAMLARDYPERHAWWEAMEALKLGTTQAAGRFSSRFARADLGRMVRTQRDWLFTTEGALCQADDGECTGDSIGEAA